MDFTEQITTILKSGDPEKTIDVTVGDRVIPVRYKPAARESRILIIVFHGGVDRSKRAVPAFANYLPSSIDAAHQILVSDPSMLVEGEHTVCWYAGDEGFASQTILKEFFAALRAALNIDRMIYLGGSAGGLASLYYSWHDAGSVAVVGNPQTNFTRDVPGLNRKYRQGCWSGKSDLSDVVCHDVSDLYAQETSNFVVYIQSTSDFRHVRDFMARFMNRLHKENSERVILKVDHFGTMGHSLSGLVYVPWIQAAITVPEVTYEAMMEVGNALAGQQANAGPQPKTDNAQPGTFDARKLRIADTIRDWQLQSETPWPQTPTNPSPAKPSGAPPSRSGTTLISKLFGIRST